MKFTDIEMIEISRIKEGLVEFRNKIQPYPPLPQPTEELPYKVRGLTNEERDEFNQMKAHILFLENKLNTFLEKKRKKYKYK